ncbi:MAG: hypothetical protein ACRDN6_11055 [Gaiellaceae bacterium]
MTPTMRGGFTREQWASGEIPMQAAPTRFPERLKAQVIPRVRRPSRQSAWVVLESADHGRAVFELVIVKRGGRWLVDDWGPVPAFAAEA